MKDNTLIALVIGGAALWYFSKTGGLRIGSEAAMKNSGGLQTPLPKSGGLQVPGATTPLGAASSTVLNLPAVKNNADTQAYVTAGANLLTAGLNAWSAYKNATPAASSFVVGPNDTVYAPKTGNAGQYYAAV